MLEQKTQIFLRRLREQSNLAYSENTLSGIFYVMYGFVEIIENDPIFSKFIQTKVYEENEIQRNINKEYREKKMDKQLWHELFRLHVANKFWHEYYSLFKAAHDSIKLDRCHALNKKADNIATHNLLFFDASDPRFLKRLTKEEAEFHTNDFEKCIDKIVELINSDQKLLNQIYNELEKGSPKEAENIVSPYGETEDDKLQNPPRYTYNPMTELGNMTFKEEGINFEGRRALILRYFFINNPKHVTHRDFSEWLKSEKIKKINVSSVNFRQDIEKISKRIQDESKYIKSVITKAKKSRKLLTEINFYDFEILYK